MKLSHAAALALVTWYLIVPPKSPTGQIMNGAPFSQWRIISSFDSASACQKWLSDFRASAKTEADQKTKGMSGEWTAAQWQDWVRSLLLEVGGYESFCIASDDPRLKSK